MTIFILGWLLLIIAPVITFIIMLYYSKKQDNDLALWDEYEEKIRDIFTLGFIVIPLIALFMITLGVKCLNM